MIFGEWKLDILGINDVIKEMNIWFCLKVWPLEKKLDIEEIEAVPWRKKSIFSFSYI